MRILLDTNVLLDYCDADRVPFHAECMDMLVACTEHDITVCACAGSLKDVYYILGRKYGEAAARQATARLMDLVKVLPLLVHDLHVAIDSDEPDFEDGLIRAVAESGGMAAIVTRDAAAFASCPIPHCTPREFVERYCPTPRK